MKMPSFDSFQEQVLSKIYNFKNKYLSLSMIESIGEKVSNFIFKRSADTAFVLLVLNAISTITSHLAQIGGLKKNKRENSDYLINQEWQELGLDMVFTIIPPFILNNFLMKKLDSGEWTTRSAREKLIRTIAPTVGVGQDDLYNTQHINSFRETAGSFIAGVLDKIENKLLNDREHPQFIDDAIAFARRNRFIRVIDPNRQVPLAGMENIATEFDEIRGKAFQGFHNGSAYDEICGQRNGILVLAAITYTVIASAVITPIIKNKLSNRSYKKHIEKLKKMNIENFHKYKVLPPRNDNGIFDAFSYIDSTIEPKNITASNNEIRRPNRADTFSDITKINNISSQTGRLRI